MIRSADDVERALQVSQLIERGGLDLHHLPAFLRTYLDGTTRLHHPGYLAPRVAVPDVPAAPAGLIHGVTNKPTAIYETGAAGASVERAVLTWMAEKLGFDARPGGGVLTHGGSLANLNALPPAITRRPRWRRSRVHDRTRHESPVPLMPRTCKTGPDDVSRLSTQRGEEQRETPVVR
jgi:L-2,4-diaminobutyrate decarboxylase